MFFIILGILLTLIILGIVIQTKVFLILSIIAIAISIIGTLAYPTISEEFDGGPIKLLAIIGLLIAVLSGIGFLGIWGINSFFNTNINYWFSFHIGALLPAFIANIVICKSIIND